MPTNQIGYLNNSKQLSALPIYNTVNPDHNEQYTKRYYSSTEAHMFMNGVDGEVFPNGGFVDEIVGIQFTIQQNVLPLFGYNSYVYDEVAVGSRIIQGSFSINFTSPNYLFDMIASINGDIYTNKNRRPLWQAPFSIDVVYGGKDTTINNQGSISNIKTHRGTLESVSIISCSQELNTEGNPVLEHYTFMARDYIPNIDYVENTSEMTSPSDKSIQNKDKNQIHNTIKLSDVLEDVFIWKATNGHWSLRININKNYVDEITSGDFIAESGFIPNGIKAPLVRMHDDGSWIISNIGVDETTNKHRGTLTFKILGSGEQSTTMDIPVRETD